MGGTLFDIVGEFEELYAMASDEQMDEQVFNDTLEALTGELEVKGAGYVAVINQLDMEAKKAKELAEDFKRKADVRINAIGRMKDALKVAMNKIGTDKIEAGDYTIKLQKNGGKQPLIIDGDVPEAMCKVILEPDKERIRTFLENLDENGSCEWAHLEERGKHIVIK